MTEDSREMERWRIYSQYYEWQCSPINKAALEAAKRGDYPDGEMVHAADAERLNAARRDAVEYGLGLHLENERLRGERDEAVAALARVRGTGGGDVK